MDMSSAPRDRGAAPPARPRPGSRPARSCVARRMSTRRGFLRSLAAAPAALCPALAAAGWRPPSAARRLAAIGALDDVAPALRPAFTPGPDDVPLGAPGQGDWLAQHDEPGQTFARFRASRLHRPDATRRSIALLPIGALADDVATTTLIDFATRFFGMPARELPAIAMRALNPRSRARDSGRQYRSPDILAALKERVPDDAYCLIAVTQSDLYPGPSWNFVFGEALLYARVGVYSFARYDPAFYGAPRTAGTKALILRRSLKLMAHEVGHMFGVEHCVHFRCVMNGTNNLDETDRSPLHPCPVCLRKLHDSIGFDVKARERALYQFCRKHGLAAEAGVADRRLARLR
jgi:archaemetzincin